MRRTLILVTVGFIAILVSSILLYPESIRLMRGDYILSRWVGVVETNKNWGIVFWLGLVGGCLVYIGRRLWRRKKKRD